MSLKLRLASVWTTEGDLVKMLDRVAQSTLAALDALLEKHAPGKLAELKGAGVHGGRSLEQRRAAMAAAQNERVKALAEALGRDRAVEVGREALFPVGKRLGEEARVELSVGDGPGDLERAARVLYRALGIHFTLEDGKDGAMVMRVDRCALSHHYPEEACLILGAADEGVVAGLSPGYKMRFEQRMSAGPAECLALITEAGK
jgi:hypothetical protein